MTEFTTPLIQEFSPEQLWSYLTMTTPFIIVMILFCVGYTVLATVIKVRKARKNFPGL